jgi:hypothetical protein
MTLSLLTAPPAAAQTLMILGGVQPAGYVCDETKQCDVTKTVTLRSGDMI